MDAPVIAGLPGARHRVVGQLRLDCCNAVMRYYGMTTIPMSKRGTITIPPEIRRHLGLDQMANPLLIIEERDGGLYLQPASAIPVRNIARETIQKWISEDEAEMKKIRSGKKG